MRVSALRSPRNSPLSGYFLTFRGSEVVTSGDQEKDQEEITGVNFQTQMGEVQQQQGRGQQDKVQEEIRGRVGKGGLGVDDDGLGNTCNVF